MGTDSDLKRVRQMFPEARRAVLYTPGRVASVPEGELRKDLERIWRELSPCDVVVADIPWDTPDAAVNRFLQVATDVEDSAGSM